MSLSTNKIVRCLFLFCLSAAWNATAQTFETKVESKEQLLGASFEVSFVLNSEDARRFSPPSFKDFKVVGGPHEGRSITFMNGQSTAQTAWTYELEARRAGSFTIGAASVVSSGKTLSTKPLTIQVVEPSASTKGNIAIPPGADEEIFLISETASSTAYPGQQIRWQVKVYTQISLDAADLVELPNFEGFLTKEKRRFDTRIQYQTVRGKKYAVKVLHEEAIFPLDVGDLRIGAAKVRLALEADNTMSSFFGRRTLLLQTQPIILKVKPLPEPVPNNFSGAVGQYEWNISADSLHANTDGAVTVLAHLKGNGNGRRILAPKLGLPPELEIFEPRIKTEEEYEAVDEIKHEKTWEYVVLPKQPGAYTLAPEMVFFDPDSNRYRTLTAPRIDTLHIVAGPNYQPPSAAQDTSVALPLTADLAPTWWEKCQKWFKKPLNWMFVVLPLLILALFFFLKKQRSQQPVLVGNAAPSPIHPTPQPRPAKPVIKHTDIPAVTVTPEIQPNVHLDEARRRMHEGHSKAFYAAILKALQHALSNRLNVPVVQLTKAKAASLLTERKSPAAVVEAVMDIWQTCEQALFAAQAQTEQMQPTLQLTTRVLQDLDNNRF
jgi:hypothetical protein